MLATSRTTLRPGHIAGPPLNGTSGQSRSVRSRSHSSGAKWWASGTDWSSRWKYGAKITTEAPADRSPEAQVVSSVVSRRIIGVVGHSRRDSSTQARRNGRSGLRGRSARARSRSEEHTSELQSRGHLVCRLLLEKKKDKKRNLTRESIPQL